MTRIYAVIGRLTVALIWARYGRQIRIAGAVTLGALLLGGYLAASRHVEEG